MPKISDPALLAQLNGGAPVSAGGFRPLAGPDPYKAKADTRADQSSAIEAARLGLSQAQFQAQLQQQQQQFMMQQMQINKPPEGFQRNAAGTGFEFIPGGPADPAVISARSAATKDGAVAPKTDAEKESVRAEAISKIKLARSLIDRSKNGYFTTGIGASAARAFGGTNAYDVSKDTETLQNAGALTRIMEMAAQNGGKNPLTPLSNSDFQALSSSLANLDTSQSDGQYQANVQKVIDLYQRAYDAAGGTDLEGDIDPAKRKQSMPGAMPNGGGGASGDARNYKPDPTGDRSFVTQRDQAFADESRKAFLGGATRERMDAIATKYGAQPFGPELDQALQGRAAGNLSTQFAPTPTGKEEGGMTGAFLGGAANTGFGSYAIGAANGVTAGQLGNIAQLTGGSEGGTDLAMGMAEKNAVPYFLGSLTGDTATALGLGAGLKAIGGVASSPLASSILSSPLTSDTAFGAITGAGNADDPLYGAVGGGIAGALGNVGGGYIGRKAFGMRSPAGVDNLNPGQRSYMDAINSDGQDSVVQALMDADRLGVPATAANMSPAVESLTGAAIRRNPTIAGQARSTIQKVGDGQLDRFRGALGRDLGPLDNVPQRSADLIEQARLNSGQAYGEAYANPVISTPKIESLLATPFAKEGLGYAEKIAANEGRNTKAMGFALDASGNPVLNPVPEQALGTLGAAESKVFNAENALKRAEASQLTGAGGPNVNDARAAHQQALAELDAAHANMAAQPSEGTLASSPGYTTQTIQYAKRGMDKGLEKYRNPITGKLELDDLGNAENRVLRALLEEVDTVNPKFGEARGLYAGPAGEAEALRFGQESLTQPTDMLAIQAGRQTPERLGQMQLGMRDQLSKNAGQLQNSTNPFRTLNTDNIEQRLASVYPEKPDQIANLLAQRDMEARVAGSNSRIAGNSMTAERGVADQAFNDAGGLIRPLVEGGLETAITGAPVMTIARRLGVDKLRDATTFGIGKRASQKAEQIAPLAMNTSPGDTIAQILALQEQAAQYKAAKAALAQTGNRPGQIGGTSIAAALIPFLTGDQ